MTVTVDLLPGAYTRTSTVRSSHSSFRLHPKLVRTHESTRKLARHAERGTARIRSATVSFRSGRWYGVRVHIADRWYASSKTCSACGVVKATLPLRVRVFHCDHCGLTLDRDLNAARNLAALVEARVEATSSHSWWATVNEPDGNPCKTSLCDVAGTATGRPAGSTPRRKATAQDTFSHVS